jgi:hypothetical protein
MAKVSIATFDKAPVVESATPAGGGVETRAFFAGDGDPIHMHVHRLEPGATLRLEGRPTDHLAYVWRGAVDAGGTRLEAGSSVIAEHGGAQALVAAEAGATLVAFHLKEPHAQPRGGGHVHLLPADRVPRHPDITGEGYVGGGLHADAQCPSCELWLHDNNFIVPNRVTPVHSHSEDEVIFICDGGMKLGNTLYGPGSAVAIHADTKYGFTVGPDGLSFINFRGTSPTYTAGDGSRTVAEGDFMRERVGTLSYLEPAS